MKIFWIIFLTNSLLCRFLGRSFPVFEIRPKNRILNNPNQPDMSFYAQNYIKRNELYEMMNPLYQLNAMMSPFYKMYGMDPMNAVMNPYLMGNYKNPYLFNGVTPSPTVGSNGFAMPQQNNRRPNFGDEFGEQSSGPQMMQPPMGGGPPRHAQGFNIGNPAHTFAASNDNEVKFSNNMPITGIMNPFINTAGMMNPFMNRSGVNPYYALTGTTDTMVGSPFNNFGIPASGNQLLYRMSAMNPFILGNLGIGSPFLNSGVSPFNPQAQPTNNHADLGRI